MSTHRTLIVGVAFCLCLGSLFTAAAQGQKKGGKKGGQQMFHSKIVIYSLEDKSMRTVYEADEGWEAPNWLPDGRYLLANSGGGLYRIPVDGPGPAKPEKVDLGGNIFCNNDHVIGPGGKQFGISCRGAGGGGSEVYIVNADGSGVHKMTTAIPSYCHGWSPDGKWLAFVAERGDKNFDLYRISAAGGTEQRLTVDPGYDDGPDYSPDGKWIYFNSNRSDGWDIWRIPPDGAGPNDSKAERVTHDELEDWFPHPSPDGKWLVFLSFPHGTENHNGKMEGVKIRMIPLPGKKVGKAPIQVLETIFGGQGTINVNSWSPDSKKFAFVVYGPPAK
jgi:Tol biopolymer transport system component